MPVVAFVIGALVFGAGAFIVQRVVRDAAVGPPPPPPPRRGLTSGSGRAELAEDIELRGYEGSAVDVQATALEYGAGGGAALSFLGPAGTIVGVGLGSFVGALVAAFGHEDYNDRVRGSLGEWLRDHEMPHNSAAVDAVLFRNGLLGSKHLWLGPHGELAIEFHSTDRGLGASLFSGDVQGPDAPFIPHPAADQVKSQIMGNSLGMTDGPGRRAKYAAFRNGWRAGDWYLIEYVGASDSWVTPGWIRFVKKWPLVSYTKFKGSRDGWTKVKPGADNVDQLAAAFDRAAGVDWT